MKPVVRLCISGVGGRIGRLVEALAKEDPGISVVLGIDIRSVTTSTIVVKSEELLPDQATMDIDALLIFINDPDSVVVQAESAAKTNTAVVVATTGLGETRLASLRVLSEKVPVLVSNNFSLGVNVMNAVLARMAKALPPHFQAEIVEAHHGRKLDAPSGTAKMLAQTICQSRGWDPELAISVGRQAGRSESPRLDEQVVIHSLRAGNIAGDHSVLFAGPSETLCLEHHAQSPQVFAEGALATVKWIAGKPAGWYTMSQMLGLE